MAPPPTTALGRRIQTTRAGVVTYQVHSVGWQVIEDRIRPAGNTTTAIKDLPVAAQYVWSPHYVDELILIDRDLNADGDLSDAQRLYVQQDANYNVTSVVGDADAGTAGNQWGVVERYRYDPYGRREVLNADWSLDTLLGADGTTGDDVASAGNTSDVGMLHGHQGGQHDVESHLVHFRNRDLNVVLGRWTRQDPLGYVDGGNLYQYVMSGPTRWVDPLGLQVAGYNHHPFPLHLGGSGNQPRVVYPQGSEGHTLAHDVFDDYDVGRYSGEEGRRKWRDDFSPEQRKDIIKESLLKSGVDEETAEKLAQDTVNTPGTKPGDNHSNDDERKKKPDYQVDPNGNPYVPPKKPSRLASRCKMLGKRALKVLPLVTVVWDWQDARAHGCSIVSSAGYVVFEQFNPTPVTMLDVADGIEYLATP